MLCHLAFYFLAYYVLEIILRQSMTICLVLFSGCPMCRCVALPDFFFLMSSISFFLSLFLAALGLRCCARAFCSCGEWGLLFVAVHRLLIVVASLIAEHGL